MQEQQRSQVRLWPTVQPINGSTIPISHPRTSRDAGPYLARMVFAGGKASEAEGRADRPRSAGVKGIRDRVRRQGQGKVMQEQQRSQVRLRPTVQPINGSTTHVTTADQQGRWSLPGNDYDQRIPCISPCPRVPLPTCPLTQPLTSSGSRW